MKPLSVKHLKFIESDAQQRLSFISQIGIAKAIPKRGYYVYGIIEGGEICYIGKGKGQRVLTHFYNSSNQLLASKIRDNQSFYDWAILDTFESEYESFEYEERLIVNCKQTRHKLYNKAHYSHYNQFNSLVRVFFKVLTQFENLIFDVSQDYGVLKPNEVADIFFNTIKRTCSGMKQIPTYNSKPINELSYSVTMVSDKMKINVF